MRRGLRVLAVVLFFASAPQAQHRDPAGALLIAGGKAAVSGRVTDAQTQQPIEGAVVTLETADFKGRMVALTDQAGGYAFEGVAGGQYRITASFGEYVTQSFGLPAGTTAIHPSAGAITIEPAQIRRNLDIALMRGSSIAGRVRSHDGRPLSNANVGVVGETDPGVLAFVSKSGRTNERGEFVIANLPPGSYHVRASWSDPAGPRSVVRSRPVALPGGDGPDDAVNVVLRAGESVGRIDFVVPESRLLIISGTFVRAGNAGPLEAYLFSAGKTPVELAANSDGSFSTPRLTEGRYTVAARSETNGSYEAVAISVDVSAEMRDVVLGLLPAASIRGRVVTDDGSPLPDRVQIAAVLVDGEKELDPYRRDRADIAPDGRFALYGLFGERVLQLTGFRDGWDVQRVTVGKTTTTKMVLAPGDDVRDVLVVLTRQ